METVKEYKPNPVNTWSRREGASNKAKLSRVIFAHCQQAVC